jgi:hypothetical protein
MPRAKKTTTKKEAAAHPLVCPFSGKPMEIRQVGPDAHFMVLSPHGFTSKLMQTREQCLEWASFRLGEQTYTSPKIEVRELTPPDVSAEEGLREIAPDPDSLNDEELPESLR